MNVDQRGYLFFLKVKCTLGINCLNLKKCRLRKVENLKFKKK